MILSILICSLNKRAGMLAQLLGELSIQIERLSAWDKVEVLVEIDGGEKPTGTKRNILYEKARGKYLCSHDDDDTPAKFYIEELLKAAESDADCFAMRGVMTTNGSMKRDWYISREYDYCTKQKQNGEDEFFRYPNHITAIRATIAKQFKFPDAYFAEDYAWALAIHQSGLIKTEYRIERHPMYIYNFNSKK